MTNELDNQLSQMIDENDISAAEVLESYHLAMQLENETPEDQATHRVVTAILDRIEKDGVSPDQIPYELERRLQSYVAKAARVLLERIPSKNPQ